MYRAGTASRTACRPTRAATAKTTPPRPIPSEAAMPFGREVASATLATMTKLGPGLTTPMASAPTMPNRDASSCMGGSSRSLCGLNAGVDGRRARSAQASRGTPCWSPIVRFSTLTSYGIRSGSLLLELLGEPDENSFGTSDVAEPIHVFILDHFADELRAAVAEPGERVVDVLHGEHDA